MREFAATMLVNVLMDVEVWGSTVVLLGAKGEDVLIQRASAILVSLVVVSVISKRMLVSFLSKFVVISLRHCMELLYRVIRLSRCCIWLA